MSDSPATTPAHPEALDRWRELAGEPDPEAGAWAERVLGLVEAGQRTA